ncbi:MAG: Cys-tRNA(Pro) deacylase [Acidimicrobiia bacterium]|nr:Cys-tRNA(Pro) deacylase [Acidimicrobiia bacterium]
MTPAVRALEAAGVAFSVHEYEHDGGERDYGVEAVRRLGLDPDQVFKTLLVTGHGAASTAVVAVAVVPVSTKLALKAAGAALGVKRVELCDPAVAERVTGYVLGGISPFGQRRALPTVIDETCHLYDVVYVSGGRRGLDVGVAPSDLIRLLHATTAALTA